MLFHGNGLNIGRNRQNILCLIEICLAAHFNSPLSGLRIKNICPFIFAWVYITVKGKNKTGYNQKKPEKILFRFRDQISIKVD
jgi:hypothetical protein